MSQQVNTFIDVDYPLCAVYNIPASRDIKFFTGYLFPSNESIDYAIIDRGDNTTTTVHFSALSAQYNSRVDTQVQYTDFFPAWKPTLRECVEVATPKFIGDYTYPADGTYTLNVTLVTNTGIGYRGTPVVVDIRQYLNDRVPENWSQIAQEYKPTASVDDIYADIISGFHGFTTNRTGGGVVVCDLPRVDTDTGTTTGVNGPHYVFGPSLDTLLRQIGYIRADDIFKMNAKQFQDFLRDLQTGGWANVNSLRFLGKSIFSQAFKTPREEFKYVNNMINLLDEAVKKQLLQGRQGLVGVERGGLFGVLFWRYKAGGFNLPELTPEWWDNAVRTKLKVTIAGAFIAPKSTTTNQPTVDDQPKPPGQPRTINEDLIPPPLPFVGQSLLDSVIANSTQLNPSDIFNLTASDFQLFLQDLILSTQGWWSSSNYPGYGSPSKAVRSKNFGSPRIEFKSVEALERWILQNTRVKSLVNTQTGEDRSVNIFSPIAFNRQWIPSERSNTPKYPPQPPEGVFGPGGAQTSTSTFKPLPSGVVQVSTTTSTKTEGVNTTITTTGLSLDIILSKPSSYLQQIYSADADSFKYFLNELWNNGRIPRVSPGPVFSLDTILTWRRGDIVPFFPPIPLDKTHLQAKYPPSTSGEQLIFKTSGTPQQIFQTFDKMVKWFDWHTSLLDLENLEVTYYDSDNRLVLDTIQNIQSKTQDYTQTVSNVSQIPRVSYMPTPKGEKSLAIPRYPPLPPGTPPPPPRPPSQPRQPENPVIGNDIRYPTGYTFTNGDTGNGTGGAKTAAPALICTTLSVSSTPLEVDFYLANVVGRSDIDYIEWIFGDGSSRVVDFRDTVIYPQFATFRYTYPFSPLGVNYVPKAIIYTRKGTIKKKFIVIGDDISLQTRSNIIQSVRVGGQNTSQTLTTEEVLGDLGFTIQPWSAPDVLTDSQFVFNIQKDLEYIFMDFGDGKFETIPATYSPSLSGINQVQVVNHRYTSTNYNKILPEGIFVYRDSAGSYKTKRYRASRYIEYGRANLRSASGGNYFKSPTIGTKGFRKFNNITIQPIYTDEDPYKSDIAIRLDLGLHKQVYALEKIIWTINGVKIVQDKQTSKHFGYITLKDVVLPFTDFTIQADIYGVPATLGLSTTEFNISYIATYNYVANVPSYPEALEIDYRNYTSLVNYSPAVVTFTTNTATPNLTSVTATVETIIDTPTTETTIYNTRAFVFDKVFSAVNPPANFINRNNPSTVSNLNLSLETKRDIGFFRPSKSSIVVLDSGKFSFVVNLDKVNTDTIYYAPDPFKYGSNTQALTFNIESSSFKKGYSFGVAGDEPNTTEDSTTFYGYTSTSTNNKYEDLSFLYDEGYIHDIKSDVFGNQYGLIKDFNNFKKYVEPVPVETTFAAIFNGYKFFDSYFGQGKSFDYYTQRDYEEINTYVPGLSTYTGGFTSTGYQYRLKFGSFTQSPFPVNPTPIDVSTIYASPTKVKYVDGGVFAFNKTTPVIDTVSSDLSSNQYPGSGSFYYTGLIECGAHQASPYIRPLEDSTNTFTQSITANFTQSVVVSGNNGVTDFDCGVLNGSYPSFDYRTTNSLYLTGVDQSSLTQYVTGDELVESKLKRDSLPGTIFIKDKKGEVKTFQDVFTFAEAKYGSAVYSELSAVQSFDLVYNTYFIQTPSYLIIDSIDYSDRFNVPRTQSVVIEHSLNSYNKLSNRFKHKDNVYFAVLSAHNTQTPFDISIIPQLYKFNTTKFELANILPFNSTLTDTFKIESSVIYTEADSPKLVYNGDVDEFNLSYLVKDQNKTPALISVRFDVSDLASVKDVKGFNFVTNNNTTLFSTLTSVSAGGFTSLIQSTTPLLSSNGLIL